MNKLFWPIINSLAYLRLISKKIFISIVINVNTIFYYVFLRKSEDSLFTLFLKFKRAHIRSIKGNTFKSKGIKPIVFVSSCVDQYNTGGQRYNGGIKQLNLLVKVLRQNSFEAYLVTYDGTYVDWLIEHQPTISIEQFVKIKKGKEYCVYVTSYLDSHSFLKYCDKVYYWDMELALSDNIHFSKTYKNVRKGNFKIAGCNSMICAWHQVYWNMPCRLLPDWVDQDFWYPNNSKIIANRIGYMNEGSMTFQRIEYINSSLKSKGYDLEFFLIEGVEKEILEKMRTCIIFLGMNPGKDPLWGEGFGLPGIEAMSVGCVVIANDFQGNREFIHNNFNGFLISNMNLDNYVERIEFLLNNQDIIEKTSENGLNFIKYYFGKENIWLYVKEFLDL